MKIWQSGERVFVYWQDDNYYYPATIVALTGDGYQIRWDTGEEETTSGENIEAGTVSVDENYECIWSEDGEYYEGRIASVSGENVEVEWLEDNTRDWATVSDLRYWYQE